MTDSRGFFRWMLIIIAGGLLSAACSAAAPASPTAQSKATAPASAPEKPAGSPAAAASPAAAGSPAAKPDLSSAAAKPAAFDEQAVASFYRGKTVRLVVGYAPGGGNDLAARMLARHMPKHLPGSPNIVVENKPGAATMLAANTVYNTEPKDGTVFANFNPQLLLSQAIKAEGVEFDAAKFNWLGAGTKEPVICVVRSDRGVDTIQQAMGGKELILPTTGPGSPPHDTPSVLNATLGTRFKLIGGYGGSAEQTLAVENGEADGKCGILDTGTLAWLDRGFAKVLIIMGSQTPDHPHLKGVPAAETLAKNDEDRALLRAVNAPSVILRSFFAPPGVPADRVAALQQAVSRAFEDPEFKAEAIQAKFSLDPSTGSEVAKVVDDVLGTPAPVLTRLKQILGT